MKELLIGCGKSPKKCLFFDNQSEFRGLVTLDNNADHKPDILWDLNNHPLPIKDDEFDEIHAYDVLEHLGSQGNYRFFFSEFTEYARVLKPGGFLFATVPSRESAWAWGDPSHTRIVHPNNLVFLSQEAYEKGVGETQMSDFRYLYKADLRTVYAKETKDKFYFILRNNK
jgi:SAM-dependent methyltransferase